MELYGIPSNEYDYLDPGSIALCEQWKIEMKVNEELEQSVIKKINELISK